MKTPHDFLAALRWEIALNVGDQINQYAEQNGDLNDIVEEKLDTPSNAACRVQSQRVQQISNQRIQPLHAEDLICDELAHQEQHPPSSFEPQPQQVSPSINSLNWVSVSQFRE